MDANAIITVSAAVVALVQLCKWSPIPTTGFTPVVLVMGFSALGVFLWGFSNELVLNRQLIWPYFSGWILVCTSSAGVYGFAQASHQAITGNQEPVTPVVVVTTSEHP